MKRSSESRALETPEVIEAILVKVPIRTLLVSATRVSKFWNTVINTSPSLQQTLFFAPESSSDDLCYQQTRPNPFFEDWIHHEDAQPEISTHLRNSSRETDILSLLKNDSWKYPDASWRRMLLEQPPRELHILTGHIYGKRLPPQRLYQCTRLSQPRMKALFSAMVTSVMGRLSSAKPLLGCTTTFRLILDDKAVCPASDAMSDQEQQTLLATEERLLAGGKVAVLVLLEQCRFENLRESRLDRCPHCNKRLWNVEAWRDFCGIHGNRLAARGFTDTFQWQDVTHDGNADKDLVSRTGGAIA
ncbi:hypothetical protein F5Y15DRAFT_410615 [Xylariaceae sp. FL0016]|nr:hypothetical protein F5Y15DRAFT_410615 [Xylariaceae sp. FL0016]